MITNLCILKNEKKNSDARWIEACHEHKLDYEVVDLTKSDWLENIRKSKCDVFLLCPPGYSSHLKIMYDERVYIISQVLRKATFPTYSELLLHENKKFLSYWLESNNLPFPKTKVFYKKCEAINYINDTTFPVVAKTNIGSSGSGVVILKNRAEGKKYIHRIFSEKGIKSKNTYSFQNIFNKVRKLVFENAYRDKAVWIHKTKKQEVQKKFCIFQEFIEHSFEWRAVKIGSSYFAYKKLKVSEKASGTKEREFVNPPTRLLDFIKEISDTYNFTFMAFDIFESNGEYLINELQTSFGQQADYLLKVNDIPGRYLYQNGNWIFQEGEFNSNQSYNLRLESILNELINTDFRAAKNQAQYQVLSD